LRKKTFINECLIFPKTKKPGTGGAKRDKKTTTLKKERNPK
jgi:hypothetical protein